MFELINDPDSLESDDISFKLMHDLEAGRTSLEMLLVWSDAIQDDPTEINIRLRGLAAQFDTWAKALRNRRIPKFDVSSMLSQAKDSMIAINQEIRDIVNKQYNPEP